MGLLDLFKSKITRETQARVAVPNATPCDINATAIVAKLLLVPQKNRNYDWYRDFNEHVETASFASTDPQVSIGPDGFPYFTLRTPEPDVPFDSYCIKNLVENFLLPNGLGVVFNPGNDKTADWVFTHGNIVNYHLNNLFFSDTDTADTDNIAFNKTVGEIKQSESVMIAQPSQDYLPQPTRRALRNFLITKGIKNPEVMMLSSFTGGKLVRKLAFNIHPEDFPVVSKLDYLMQQVGWFLPTHYLIIPLPKISSLQPGFCEL